MSAILAPATERSVQMEFGVIVAAEKL